MIHKRWTLGVLLLILITASVNQGNAFEWKRDFNKALEDAKALHKPALAFFYHTYYYQNPRKIREDFLVWDSPLVKKYENHFIAIVVNAESHDDIVTKYRVSTFPTVCFFDPQGREIKALRLEEKTLPSGLAFNPLSHELRSMKGGNQSLTRTNLAVRLKQVLKNIEEFSLVEQQISQYSSNPKMVLLYAKGLRDRAQFEQAEEQFYRLMQWKDLDDSIQKEVTSAYTNMLFFQAAVAFYDSDYDHCIEIMERFIDKNPNNKAVSQARLLLGMAFYESGRNKEGEKVLKELSRNKKVPIIQQQAKNYLAEKRKG